MHTIFDDLESFAWLALWIAASRCPEDPESQKILDSLDKDDFSMLSAHKTMLASGFTEDWMWDITVSSLKPESAIRAIGPLLREWFSIINKSKSLSIMVDWDESFVEKGEENGFFEEMQTRGEQVCFEYLAKAVEFLDTLPPDSE